MPPSDEPTITATYEGWFSRLLCGHCGEMFEIEDDVQNGETVMCDACGTDQEVERAV